MRIVANTVTTLVFRRHRATYRFLLLKRAPARGGFWQSVSGKVRRGERAERAAVRETSEETGLHPTRVLTLDGVGGFYAEGVIHLEPSFGVEVRAGTVALSAEHVAYRWVTAGQAVRLLRWPGNRAAIRQLVEELHRPRGSRRSSRSRRTRHARR